ncbi:hypothetical protein [Parabacteroides sp.]|uniref:hypothetical protein n=1 Tax=Parabacteroides sp. TaxID=1869337 RepID=UPI00257DB2C1|nr:hypothetical protein [Parabacteroides sp.]
MINYEIRETLFVDCCDDGTCLGVLNAGDICDYIDENGISSNPNLNFLKSISPDDNPVVVFMEN